MVLLEALTVGSGSTTGGSTAKVSALQGAAYSTIAARADLESARTYAQSQVMAVEHLAGLVKRVGIDCSLERRPSWLFAEDDRELAVLRAEAAALAECELDVTTDADPGLPFDVTGTIRLNHQLLIDPVAYLDGLARDFVSRGGRLFENSRVVEVDPGDPHRAHTQEGGTVRAAHVVVATHFPAFAEGVMFARLKTHREHVLTGPMPAGTQLRDMYVGVGGETPALRPVPGAQGSVLMVSGAPFQPGRTSAAVRLSDLVHWAQDRLPGYDVARQWSVQDHDSPDRLPFIGEMKPITRPGSGVWGATGFGGWGIANGVLAGVLLRDMILDADDGGSFLTGQGQGWRDLFTLRRGRWLAEGAHAAQQGRTFVSNAVGGRLGAATTAALPDSPTGWPPASPVGSSGASTWWRRTGTGRAPCTRSPRPAPTWAAWWTWTRPPRRGSAPATAPASTSPAPSSRGRPPPACDPSRPTEPEPRQVRAAAWAAAPCGCRRTRAPSRTCRSGRPR